MKLIISNGHKHGTNTILHTHGPVNPTPEAKLGYVKP